MKDFPFYIFYTKTGNREHLRYLIIIFICGNPFWWGCRIRYKIYNSLMNLESTEEIIIKMNEKQILDYAMKLGIFKKEMSCSEFCKRMKLQKASRYVDGYTWRCTNKICI
ncbi:hypothetical protein H311_02878 [Anncaliia algerae PRA109]|nr:hypothetical protein H311_02878 [Anncaliia algerae PRA109]